MFCKVVVALFALLNAAMLLPAPQELRNPMEDPDLFEGDISEVPGGGRDKVKVAAHLLSVNSATYRWTNGIVPFLIDAAEYNDAERATIISAMNEIEARTAFGSTPCIRFVPRTNENAYLTFYRGSGCSSPIGRSSTQPQRISLASGCVYRGIVMHEIIHSLGFRHMQSRTDRDDYVTVFLENVAEASRHNFNVYPQEGTNAISYLGLPYDIESIMHYGKNSFSTNGQPTIVAKDPAMAPLMGQRTYLTKGDYNGIQKMYGCTVTAQ